MNMAVLMPTKITLRNALNVGQNLVLLFATKLFVLIVQKRNMSNEPI